MTETAPWRRKNFPSPRHKKSRCRLFHDWSKWNKPAGFDMIDLFTGQSYIQLRQRRSCNRCGLYQDRSV